MRLAIRLNTLFWKIFAAFLVANILVMGLTSYIVLEASQSELMRESHRRFTVNTAAMIVERIEQGQFGRAPDSSRRAPGHMEHRLQRRMEIYNARGQRIFGRIEKELGDAGGNRNSGLHSGPGRGDNIVEYSFISSGSGQRFRVLSVEPRRPGGVARLLGFIQSVRLVLLLMASALVSLILSLLISRPLKQLGLHARSLASGDLHTRLAQRLIERGDEIGELSRELDNMASQLDSLINSRQQLLHDVSHELRAPLARLQAASALLEQKADGDHRHVQRIEKECRRMDVLIQEILDYARLESTAEADSAVDLCALLAALVKDIQYEYPSHPVRFLQMPEAAVLTGSEHSLRSALENILRNACRHTEDDTAVDIELTQAADNWNIRIRDHGPGVDEQELDSLTKPFYRARQRMHGEGAGLGLSIAQRAIEQHGGTMSIGNHPGGGLELNIQLPRR